MRIVGVVVCVVACSQPTGLKEATRDAGGFADARPAVCGDGIVEGDEICDDGNTTSGDGCSADCLSDETCGNGIVDVNEACDDGNTVGGDGCSADCKSDETCGNGIIDHSQGETCDDGNTHGGDMCSANCQSNLQCGNNIVDPGEDCDSGNQFTATCNPDCTFARCGDGIVNPKANEACDDGNSSNTDECTDSCQLARCGDGFVEAGVEECDDGNTDDGDGCDSSCNLEVALTNGSFENNYDSWTITADSGSSAWGIGMDGMTITSMDMVFDFGTMTQLPADCLGATGDLVLAATDGNNVAFNLQVGPGDHRIYQDITIPNSATTLSWDMAYRNATGFDPMQQFTAINIRDPEDDSIIATVFKTDVDAAMTVAMSNFTADISAYAGMTVRLDVEHQVENDCFDIVWDNFTIR